MKLLKLENILKKEKILKKPKKNINNTRKLSKWHLTTHLEQSLKI